MKASLFLILIASAVVQIKAATRRSDLIKNGLGWGANRVASALKLEPRAVQSLNRPQWKQFRNKHRKTYRNHSDEELHARVFEDSEELIAEHNTAYERGEETYKMGLNRYADYTEDQWSAQTPTFTVEEIKNLFDGASLHNETKEFRSRRKRFVRPAEIDWRSAGIVSDVKDQGDCGSCYTFATIGALEAHYYRKTNRTLDLSEQNLMDCTGRYGNGGCRGGWIHNCYKYIMENRGLNQEHNYRYEGKANSCRYQPNDAQARISGYVMIPKHHEIALADAVASVGPVAVAYDASTREFMLYKNGIFHSENCDRTRTTHSVVVVGYGTEKGVDFWTIKNSWGVKWGEKGYFRMRRNTNNKCGVATASSYPVLA